MAKFIVIRGLSGSGKSSIASELQKNLDQPSLLVSEDKIRQMFSDRKEPDHVASKKLATKMVITGLENGHNVIYEGISNIKTYKPYFDEILKVHCKDNFFFYLDVSFDETVRRHNTRPQKSEFSVDEMKRWWDYASPSDYDSEMIIPENSTLQESVQTILEAVK